ncbi:hypothetical protein OCGS_1717 [Oceaniovalibus guishaninsula JLT2003]|uniref:Uncharacterized protein n=1 Tax=Oceaniovalibus guishaninsula JLT2003 TaxID=1231392 RepID=K2GNJ6_9RHOB|nr:hypothetical protein OCGS_1717 [Oceaniovalibus guishaninsula JLT2003]
MAEAEAAVGAGIAGRGQPDFGIEGAKARGGPFAGQRPRKAVGQELDGLAVKLGQPFDGGGGVGETLMRARLGGFRPAGCGQSWGILLPMCLAPPRRAGKRDGTRGAVPRSGRSWQAPRI